MLAAISGSLGDIGCNKEWDAQQGRKNLEQAGYSVGPASPDEESKRVPVVKSGECFDVSKGTQSARVCVWTCDNAVDCINIPAQRVWMHSTIGRRNAYVDTKDEAFGYSIIKGLNK